MDSKLLKKIPTLQNTDVTDKTCLVRVDFNVPIKHGKIVNPARILAAKQTINYLLKANAKIVLLSHLSRIKSFDDIKSGKKSLKVVANYLKKLFPKQNIIFVKNNVDRKLPSMIKKMSHNDIILLENTRYQDVDQKTKQVVKLESKNNPKLAKFWTSLGEVYVNDAFATIHRGHASNAGIASFIKTKCVGFLIQNELENIVKFDRFAAKPVVSLIGGAKISDKITLLEKLAELSDQLLIGGAMANTFLAALGVNVGKSLTEPEMYKFAKNLYYKHKDKILLPVDVVVNNKFEDTVGQTVSINKIPSNKMALDLGPKTIKQYQKVISLAKTIFWNGPTGVNEFNNYSKSSNAFSSAIAIATGGGAFSLIGGGDTITAATKIVAKTDYSFASTGGGATLAVLADDELPGLFFRRK